MMKNVNFMKLKVMKICDLVKRRLYAIFYGEDGLGYTRERY